MKTFDDLFSLHRYFNAVDTKEELDGLKKNAFIQVNDVVYCREDKNYYNLGPDYNWALYSTGDQHVENILFFHKLCVDDTLTTSDNVTCTIVDIRYSLKLGDGIYRYRTPEGKEGEALVSVVDGILTENGTAMSTTLLVSDL